MYGNKLAINTIPPPTPITRPTPQPTPRPVK